MKKKYNWKEISDYYNDGHTVRQCKEKFGFAVQSFADAVKRGDIKAKGVKPLHELKSNSKVKARLIKNNLVQYVCSICSNTGVHNNKPLVLQIDHIDGNRYNNILSNLRFLCPNCHSQTDTFTSKLGKNRYTK